MCVKFSHIVYVVYVCSPELCWCDGGLHTVECVQLDGTRRRTLITGTTEHYYGIAMTDTHLYITVWATRYATTNHLSSIFSDTYLVLSVSSSCVFHCLTTILYVCYMYYHVLLWWLKKNCNEIVFLNSADDSGFGNTHCVKAFIWLTTQPSIWSCARENIILYSLTCRFSLLTKNKWCCKVWFMHIYE